MTPIPLSPFITTNNLPLESACPQADTPTVAASSRPDESPAAAVTHSPREVSSAVAPGMARSLGECSSRASVAEVLRPASDGRGKELQSHSGEIPELAAKSHPLDIPDFLRRVRIKPEGEASVITKANENIAGAK